MAAPPRIKSMTLDQFPGAPDWFGPFLVSVNETLTALGNGVDKQLTRSENLAGSEKLHIAFTTKTPASATWPLMVKNDLGTTPKHVAIGQIYRKDGKTMANACSLSWVYTQTGNIAVTILGLENKVAYVLSLNYE